MLRFLKLQRLSSQQFRNLCRFALRRLGEDRLPQVAGSLTFTTVLSLVPILTIALAIFAAFPLFSNLRESLEAYLVHNLMPTTRIAETILGYLNQFASKSARLSAVGGVALIFTSIMTIVTIEQAFNQIWRVRRPRPLMNRMLVYWCLITLGPVLLGLSISATTFVSSLIDQGVNGFPLIASTFAAVSSIIWGAIAFALLYIIVPHQKVHWQDALWGGLVASIAIEIAKKLFTAYILKLPTYTMIYGALAILPIFLLWIYMMWLITLVGAIITAALPTVRYERWWHVAAPGSDFVDAMVILKTLRNARVNQALSDVDIALLRLKTRLGNDELETLLTKMIQVGWVGIIQNETHPKVVWRRQHWRNVERYVLLANPDTLTLADVYRLFVFDTEAHENQDQQVVGYVNHAIEEALSQNLNAYFTQEQEAIEGQKNNLSTPRLP